MQKTGILVVSFGTSYHDSLVNNIQAIEKTIGENFPGCELRRAFTSGMIIRKLKTRDGIHVDTVAEALDSFLRDGFTDLIVQPTHIINGWKTTICWMFSVPIKTVSILCGSAPLF